MIKYFITIFFCTFSFFCQAADNMESSYIPKRQAVKNFIGHDPLRNCAYQTLIHSQRLFDLDKKNPDKHNFVKVANGVWKDMRNRKLPAEEKEESLKAMLDAYFQYLPPNIRSLAEERQLVKKSYWSWDRIENRYGWGVTTGLKYLLSTAIMCSFVICPTAATIMSASAAPITGNDLDDDWGLIEHRDDGPPSPLEKGPVSPHINNNFVPRSHPESTFKSSCKNIQEQPYFSTDTNVEGPYFSIKAQCSYDRVVHGYKDTHIILPDLENPGDRYYVHNCNGTLIANRRPSFRLEPPYKEPKYNGITIATEANSCPFRNYEEICPTLQGSYRKSCEPAIGTPYKSSDPEIPEYVLCQYKFSSCKDVNGNLAEETNLYIPSQTVRGYRVNVENCDGKPIRRSPPESDRQCETLKSNRVNETKS